MQRPCGREDGGAVVGGTEMRPVCLDCGEQGGGFRTVIGEQGPGQAGLIGSSLGFIPSAGCDMIDQND